MQLFYESRINSLICDEIIELVPHRSDETTHTEPSTILPLSFPTSINRLIVLLSGIEPS